MKVKVAYSVLLVMLASEMPDGPSRIVAVGYLKSESQLGITGKFKSQLCMPEIFGPPHYEYARGRASVFSVMIQRDRYLVIYRKYLTPNCQY